MGEGGLEKELAVKVRLEEREDWRVRELDGAGSMD